MVACELSNLHDLDKYLNKSNHRGKHDKNGKGKGYKNLDLASLGPSNGESNRTSVGDLEEDPTDDGFGDDELFDPNLDMANEDAAEAIARDNEDMEAEAYNEAEEADAVADQ